jgi:hypothetical protein
MQRKAYTSVETYLVAEHPGFAWVFQIQEIAKHWPGYTPELGIKAQGDCVSQAFESARKLDRHNGIEVVINVDEATRG